MLQSIRPRRRAKLSKFPQASPNAAAVGFTGGAKKSVFVGIAVQKRARAGGSVHQSGLPGIDMGWGGDGVLPKTQGFGFARCALRRTRQTPEKSGLFETASGSPGSGGDSGSTPCAPRIRALPAAGRGATPLARRFVLGPGRQSCGGAE